MSRPRFSSALCLVVLVIFLFLRNVSATVIPSLALPMSIVGTFTVMYLLNFTLDNLSLMALTLSVGFVVDDAIVVLENIVRHMEMGEDVLQAALNGSREIGFTIVSMTLSLAAVFIPVLFMGGIIGRLLHEFAVTIGMAVLVSGFVSLSLTPVLCSRFLKHSGSERHNRVFVISERFFQAMANAYDRTLKQVLAHRLTTLVIARPSASGYRHTSTLELPRGSFRVRISGMINGTTEAEQGISFEAMAAYHQALAAILRKDPNVDSFMSNVGARGRGPATMAAFRILLKPRSQRLLSADEVIQELRPETGNRAGNPGLSAESSPDSYRRLYE